MDQYGSITFLFSVVFRFLGMIMAEVNYIVQNVERSLEFLDHRKFGDDSKMAKKMLVAGGPGSQKITDNM